MNIDSHQHSWKYNGARDSKDCTTQLECPKCTEMARAALFVAEA